MSDLLLNLEELSIPHDKAEENKMKIYEKILRSCHNKIKKYNTEFKKQECLFQPPVFIIGLPPYNYVELIDYLVHSLRINGLRAEWLLNRKAIYISWKKNDVDINQYYSQFTTLMFGGNVINGPQHENLNGGDLSTMNFVNGETTQTINNGQTQLPFTVMSVCPSDASNNQKKNNKKNTNQPLQHVAMLEYKPGVKDTIPINIQGGD